MKTIRKTGTKATYFEGEFSLRNKSENWAIPIDFPTVFKAQGKAVRSGNWDSCTSINTPLLVINQYFNGTTDKLNSLWESVYALEGVRWDDVESSKQSVMAMIDRANYELCKLTSI